MYNNFAYKHPLNFLAALLSLPRWLFPKLIETTMTDNASPVQILLVDDDDEDLEMLEEAILEYAPETQVHKFTGGKQALQFLMDHANAQLPQLIVLDYNMPELNGAEMLTKLAAEPRFSSMKKAILSTATAPQHIYNELSKHANYFVKAVSRQKMQEQVAQMFKLIGQ